MQIASVLDELEPSDELVIVDDASSDNTIDIIKQFNDPRIKLHRRQFNQGVINSFEQTITIATGHLIFLCDQDDVWYPGKVNSMANVLRDREVVAAISNCQVIDSSGNIIEPSFFSKRGCRSGFLANLWRNGYLGCAMCFRADLKEVILPFPNRIFMHDEWIGLTANLSGKVLFLEKVLFGYRRHSSNVTSMTWGGVRFAIRKRFIHGLLVAQRIPTIIRYRKERLYKNTSNFQN